MKKQKQNDKLLWTYRNQTYSCQILPNQCPICKATGTLVGLPPFLVKKQPDKTNIVCHPGIGGCNHGFEMDVAPYLLYSKVQK